MRKQVAAMVGVFSLAVASVGLAATVDPNSLLTEGYDSDNHNLVWGVADHPDSEEFDGTYDCRLESGTYDYEVGEDGKVVVLTDDDGDVTYSEADDDDETTTESTAIYGETEGECDLTVTNVEGPQGQVNHGTVVASFVHALKDAGVTALGCYVRIIAQSDYGKDEQQVNVPDVEEGEEGEEGDEEVTEEPVTGSVDLTTHETTCGKPDHAGQGGPEGAGQGGPPEGKGKPEWAGPPEWAGQGRPEGAGEGRGRP